MSIPRLPLLPLMSHSFRRPVHFTVAVTAFLIVPLSAIVRFIVWQRMEHSVEHAMQAAEVQAQLTGGELLPYIPREVTDSEAQAAAGQQAIRTLHQMESSSWAALRNKYAGSLAAEDWAKHVATFPKLIALPEEHTAWIFAHVSA